MMLDAIYKGIILGLTLGITSLGPAFFSLIQTSLDNGFRSGMALAIGIFISDIFCVALVIFGAAQFISDPYSKTIISYSGGILLTMFGMITLIQQYKKKLDVPITPPKNEIPDILKKSNEHLATKKGVGHFVMMATKGFILNIVNPSVIILWITSVGLVSAQKGYTHWHVFSFFAGTLSTVVLTDILKARGAAKIKRFLTPVVLKRAGIVAGIALTIFGLSFIYRELF